MTVDIRVPQGFSARDYQIPILTALNSGIKRIVFCAHRRSGKDTTVFNWVVQQLYKETQTCFYIFPSYAQAKKAIWDAITLDGKRILDYIPDEIVAQKNQQEMKIRFKNGSLLQFVGSDNIDSLMGTSPKIVIFSEYALQNPASWDYLRPILKVNKGVAIFISTPRGRNHFYEICRTAQVTEGWWYQKLTVEDTGVLTPDDVQQEIAEGMSEELALQEYMCSFDRGVEGSYYSKLIDKMREEDRIGNVRYDPYKLVHSSWDLGWDDSTAIIFFQNIGSNIHIIDCEEHSSRTLAWYRDLINSKPYKFGTHLFPHDVEQIDGLSTGCTRREILQDMQIPVTTVARGLISDGIETTKSFLASRIYIDESKCAGLIKSLEHYHRDWDDKHKVYSNKPRHDWSSHMADGIRYMCTGHHLTNTNKGSMEGDASALRKYWGG